MVGFVIFATAIHCLGCFNLNQGQVVIGSQAALVPEYQTFLAVVTCIADVVAEFTEVVVPFIPPGVFSGINALGNHERLPRLNESATARQ